MDIFSKRYNENNLGLLYSSVGDYKKSEIYSLQALETRKPELPRALCVTALKLE